MSTATIPLCDLRQQHDTLRAEINAAMQRVAAEGSYILGPNVKAFERGVADYLGVRHAVGVGSGTDALHLALRGLGIGPGDEVITTPFTFIATTEAIGLVGAKPVFVDIDPRTYNLDPAAFERAVSPKTRAIIPVHLYGLPCDMTRINAVAEAHGVDVIEDTAQAFGAEWRGEKVATLGRAGCLSFFPSKNLGCMGDGGMVVTNDDELFERVEMLRRHGGKVKYHHSELGLNSRLDEIQAAVLRVKLPRLDRWNEQRREHGAQYEELLRGCQAATPDQAGAYEPGVAESVYHQYTVQVDDRDRVIERLRSAGVGCAVYYPVPLHLQEVHRPLGYQPGDFPHAERAAARCLSLPMFPELTPQQQATVARELKAACAASVVSDPNTAAA